MSRIVTSAAVRGAHQLVKHAEEFLNKAKSEKGENQKIEFPETAFYFPMAYALLGREVKTLKDIDPVLDEAKSLLHPVPDEKLWLPYLGAALDSGISALLTEEITVALRYLYGDIPKDSYNGFISDTILRSLGIQLVDGRMPGFAAILGKAPDNKTAVEIVRSIQQRSILSFLIGNSEGDSIKDQLEAEGVEMGWDTYIVPLGPDTISGIYALHWAIRGALMFGGFKKGQWKECLKYCKDRIFAFGLALGPIDDIRYATGAGAIDMGFPVIADTDIPEIRPTGVTTYEALVKEFDYKKIVPVCIETRGVKVKVEKIPIPVMYGPAFEGERVRRENVMVEFGGQKSVCFEWLRTKSTEEVQDGKIELVGKDTDNVEKGAIMPLAIIVDVAGRKMQEDFEPILERQLHRYINGAMGIMHMGQRNINWIRIHEDTHKAGFRLKHIGEIIRAKLLEEYPAIVDKVQTTIYTDEAKVKELLPLADKAYVDRDARVEGMTDESVDIFYSCTLCQSYAPNHVCIITPERLGLCGAYNWLDGKASFEIRPTGPNQPVPKGDSIEPVKGQWKGVNEFVFLKSNKSITNFSAYSLMEDPMTSCGCFECILAIIPEANGVMLVNREFSGMTPVGMTFTTLAGSVGGGAQTPGFLGVGRLYITSKKFISAEGGFHRLLWMPKELKDAMKERLEKRAKELGDISFVDKIADETVATTSEELVTFLTEKGHPALTMPSLL